MPTRNYVHHTSKHEPLSQQNIHHNTFYHPHQRLLHSQSITALPSIDHYSTYSTMPVENDRIGKSSHVPIVGCNQNFLNLSNTNHRWCPFLQPQHQNHQQIFNNDCYWNYNVNLPQANTPPHWLPTCTCNNLVHRHHQPPSSDQLLNQYERSSLLSSCRRDCHKPSGYQCYFDNGCTDEEDSAFPGLPDREFYLLHRNIPALRRTGIDTSSIRQYFYPDGGWGWIICGISFLVHILTTGLQLSYGLLFFYAIQHLSNSNSIEWLGALSWSISMVFSPFIVTFCRKKSTRLSAVMGGLVLPLGILFTSFATELGQVAFSYGIVFGIGVAMVRESSTIMLGNYFKRRRQFVELVAMSGEGIGIALFAVILKEGVGEFGWRFGLQIISALVAMTFFMGLLYRPASLYHPQRRAIQHLKNQRKKLKDNKLPTTVKSSSKYIFLDISILKSATVKVLLMTSGVAALGIYTPMFLMSLNAIKEGSDIQDLVLLHFFLGISTALGVVLAGAIIRRPLKIGRFLINTQIITQIFISIVAVSILFLSFVMGYKGMCILSWIYGIGFGGFRYSFKILALERVKLRQFSKTWGFIHCVESIPVLISVPLTSFLNDYSLKYGRAGYYICSAATAIAGIIIFFISYSNLQITATSVPGRKNGNGVVPGFHSRRSINYVPPAPAPPTAIAANTDYMYDGCDYPTPDLLNRSCVSLNQIDSNWGLGVNNYPLQCINHVPKNIEDQPTVHTIANQLSKDLYLGHPTSQYSLEKSSIGPRMEKRLQKSLSLIPSSHLYEEDSQCKCQKNFRWDYDQNARTNLTKQLHCNCSPTSSYWQNLRSRSVPEGLSTISKQCNCKAFPPTNQIIYLQREFGCQKHQKQTLVQHQNFYEHQQKLQQTLQRSAITKHSREQRSQSLCKPCLFVEQITTSV